MKKIILVVIIIAIGGLFYYVVSNKSPTKVEKPTISDKGGFHPDPSNATFIIEDESITLSRGKDEKEVTPGSAITEETVLMDKFAYGDVNADDKEDTALLLARYGAGSGTFIYVAVFVSGPVNYKGSNTVFIGDRISPQSISIKNGIITMKYLDRKSNEALAAEPTVPMSKQFVYKNGELVEK